LSSDQRLLVFLSVFVPRVQRGRRLAPLVFCVARSPTVGARGGHRDSGAAASALVANEGGQLGGGGGEVQPVPPVADSLRFLRYSGGDAWQPLCILCRVVGPCMSGHNGGTVPSSGKTSWCGGRGRRGTVGGVSVASVQRSRGGTGVGGDFHRSGAVLHTALAVHFLPARRVDEKGGWGGGCGWCRSW